MARVSALSNSRVRQAVPTADGDGFFFLKGEFGEEIFEAPRANNQPFPARGSFCPCSAAPLPGGVRFIVVVTSIYIYLFFLGWGVFGIYIYLYYTIKIENN